MNPFYLGAVYVILSAAGFGLLPIFALYAYQGGASVTTLLFLRFSIASLFFFTYLFAKTKGYRLTARQFMSLFLLGGIFYTIQSSLYFLSVKYIPTSLAALLLYMYPVFVAALAFFVEHEKLSRQTILSICLTITGVAIVLGAPIDRINIVGVLCAVGAALTYSCYIVFGNRVVAQIPPVTTSAFISFFAAFALLVLGIATGSLNLEMSRQAWVSVVGIALVSTVLSILAFFAGVRVIGSTKASILSSLEPVVTIVCSSLLFEERLTWLQSVGGCMVLVGTVLVVWMQKKVLSETSLNQTYKNN
ncbi:DMT family transporter [Effusibacillus pohliae]|uniref:DMT family transporter n=1 Tax=Effusibacillus pohliae TaxID=232270 RepID=UPI000363F8F3|nr:DMT family transporter [Effusibacillus pohliae]